METWSATPSAVAPFWRCQFRPRQCRSPSWAKVTPGLLFVREPVKFCICRSDRGKWYHHHHHHHVCWCCILLPCWLTQPKSPSKLQGPHRSDDEQPTAGRELCRSDAISRWRGMLSLHTPDLTKTSVQQNDTSETMNPLFSSVTPVSLFPKLTTIISSAGEWGVVLCPNYPSREVTKRALK